MKEFKNCHPIVNFIYFVFIIGFSIFFMNPLCLLISSFFAIFYSIILNGINKTKTSLLYLIPLIFITAIINSLFNHEGATVLAYFPNGNPLTLESVVYGFWASIMLISVMLWFSSYNEVMTSDKFIYLFGKIIPSLSLIFSMILRFIPKFKTHLKNVVDAQKTIGKDIKKGNIFDRIKTGVSIISIMITWSFENSIETADSMKSRGYGISGRSAYSIYIFTKSDLVLLFSIIILGIYIIYGSITGNLKFTYFPTFEEIKFNRYIIAYFFMCLVPALIELLEVRKWKCIK